MYKLKKSEKKEKDENGIRYVFHSNQTQNDINQNQLYKH